ncbi:MAG: 50S ribosomal protein L11 methyltransferase [Thermoleophilaceae bacterium]
MLAGLLEFAPGGVEQVDGDGFVEYAVYGTPGELPSLPEGEAQVSGLKVNVSGREVPDDWHERWKRFHEPVLVGERLYVRAPWEERSGRPGVEEIVIDPGRAFGTGTHPTTRLCLELMVDLEPGGSLADLGCGSGVLAIAAARLGFSPVTALDSDPAALEATRENARANGVSLDRVERLDLGMAAPPTADNVTANLMLALLVRLPELWQKPPGVLVASGLLDREADEAAAAFAPMVERRRLSRGGWTALRLTAG